MDEKKRTMNDSVSTIRNNVARLMVRRHLRSWIDAGILETEVIDLFTIAMQAYPDLSMKELTALVDRRLRESFEAEYLKEPRQ